MKLLIPCAFGVEASVKRQLKTLGYGDCPALSGRIALEGDWSDIARLNVFLRSGERVLIELGRFPAQSFDELFEGVKALPFEEFLSEHSLIRMDGKCFKSRLMAVKTVGGVAKKAVLQRLKEKLKTSFFDEKGERVIIGIHILEDQVSVTLDTSGEGLHRRGYRVKTYEAPLKETIAAAMVESSVYRAGKPFADLFCGSGTIPIEAALYALNLAPGANRSFDFVSWKCTPSVLKEARAEAQAGKKECKDLKLFACDLNEKAIELAKFHAERAGVSQYIRFSAADMRGFSSLERYGVIISNPPYGQRLEREGDLFSLYQDFGKMYRALPDWCCYFLSGYPQAERAFGGKAQKRRKLFNADIECGFYGYFGEKPPK